MAVLGIIKGTAEWLLVSTPIEAKANRMISFTSTSEDCIKRCLSSSNCSVTKRERSESTLEDAPCVIAEAAEDAIDAVSDSPSAPVALGSTAVEKVSGDLLV